MSYNKAKEYTKWCKWKNKEEEQLRKLGVDEEIINKLYEYDKKMFNMERRFKEKQVVTDDVFFDSKPLDIVQDLNTMADFLEQIENEILYEIISDSDPITYSILDLKLQGYSVKEISLMLGMNMFTIYKRIRKFKEKIDLMVKK